MPSVLTRGLKGEGKRYISKSGAAQWNLEPWKSEVMWVIETHFLITKISSKDSWQVKEGTGGHD